MTNRNLLETNKLLIVRVNIIDSVTINDAIGESHPKTVCQKATPPALF